MTKGETMSKAKSGEVRTTFGKTLRVSDAERLDLERQGLIVSAAKTSTAAPADAESTAEAEAEAEAKGGAE